MKPAIPAFSGFGIELEYMIVDRDTLAALPIADRLLQVLAGRQVSEVECGRLAWSNELALHVIELKNTAPEADLESLPALFQSEVSRVNGLLETMHACLMPTAMHPWMNPRIETRLWPHDHAEIYRGYDRIFDCKRHGWSNLQSMHLNLPFAGDTEFARLHAATRLILPILPALAASSPIAEGRFSGFLDFRMENYRTHQMTIPSTMGQVIPDTILDSESYRQQILLPMYREIEMFDPDGVLQHEWLNVRAAVARFVRHAIEIRIIDVQECPYANLAIAEIVIHVVRALYQQETASLGDQQAFGTDRLVTILHSCIEQADQAIIADRGYLSLLGFSAVQCTAGELWQHLFTSLLPLQVQQSSVWREAFTVLLQQGPLARRILRAAGQDFSREHLAAVYRALCDCLEEGRLFSGAQEIA
ncbi:MAG: glutamate--cysteine ligase [Nitrosomonas sp.]|uniref:carboxylate-amine ligase n=1 Tax=Nitrosomonas sp. TaxID=42353 RepID=UPI001DDE7C69|nr:glutamate-cysteine ligase family protein [Nitrosomonas sp.]MBX9895858.1 glutamate--cysteine ligase [Nitrosomonas sp.]